MALYCAHNIKDEFKRHNIFHWLSCMIYRCYYKISIFLSFRFVRAVPGWTGGVIYANMNNGQRCWTMEGFEGRRAFGVTRLQDETSPWCTSDFSKWSNVNIVKTKLDWIFCNTLRRLKINIAPISAHIHLLFTHKIFHEFEKLFGFFGEGKRIFLSWSIFYSRFFGSFTCISWCNKENIVQYLSSTLFPSDLNFFLTFQCVNKFTWIPNWNKKLMMKILSLSNMLEGKLSFM